MAHVILFEHAQFHGQHKHVFGAESNLNAADDNYFNDKVSSLVVLEGNWAVFADSNFQKQYPPILGPGLYPVLPAGVKNDDMSSLKPVDAGSTVSGGPVDSHVMLFEHANFHGVHKHVFTREPNLNATDDNYFNDRVSSLVVLADNWRFFADSNFMKPYPPILGPAAIPQGIAPAGFPLVGSVGIKNDDMSSLERVSMNPTVRSTLPMSPHVLLFEHANYHGAHKHVFLAEANLNAPDDNYFNDKVSSFHILSGLWVFFRDSQFQNPYANGTEFGPAIDGSWVEAVGIKNDDMSSLRGSVQ